MASRLGDQTARMQGRVTLNPGPHIDPVGTLLFPGLMIFLSLYGQGGFLFGWAKPTPVTTRNFKNIRRDDNLVTLAGPVSNLIIVFVAFVALLVIGFVIPNARVLVVTAFEGIVLGLPSGIQAIILLCVLAVKLNLILAFFNLLPIPPLDGSHIVRNMLPYNALRFYDQIGGLMSMLLMVLAGWFILPRILGPILALIIFAYRIIAHI
jgi:Zn-dependent protease